jgi:hypothetical protein
MRHLAIALAVLGAAGMGQAHASSQKPLFSYTHKSTAMTLSILKGAYDKHGDRYERPKSGMMFDLKYVRIANRSGQTRTFNPLNISELDNKGKLRESTFFLPSYYHPMLGLLHLRAHQSKTGWVGFQISTKSTYVDVYWNDDYTLSSPQHIGRFKLH